MSETNPKTEKTDSLRTLYSSHSNVYVKSIDSKSPVSPSQSPTSSPVSQAPGQMNASQTPPPGSLSQTQTAPPPGPISQTPAPVVQSSAPMTPPPMTSRQTTPNTTTVQVITVKPKSVELGPVPVNTYCPYCHHQNVTITKPIAGQFLFGSIFGCCIVTCCCCSCCFACIPACIEEFYDIDHICRNCGRSLGVYVRGRC